MILLPDVHAPTSSLWLHFVSRELGFENFHMVLQWLNVTQIYYKEAKCKARKLRWGEIFFSKLEILER